MKKERRIRAAAMFQGKSAQFGCRWKRLPHRAYHSCGTSVDIISRRTTLLKVCSTTRFIRKDPSLRSKFRHIFWRPFRYDLCEQFKPSNMHEKDFRLKRCTQNLLATQKHQDDVNEDKKVTTQRVKMARVPKAFNTQFSIQTYCSINVAYPDVCIAWPEWVCALMVSKIAIKKQSWPKHALGLSPPMPG